VASSTASDETFVVVQAETVEQERYLLDAGSFAQNYEQPGEVITEQGCRADALREQGFRLHERKGRAIIYQATETDLEFVRGGSFWGPGGSIPQPLRAGDYLVAGYPEAREVYLSRNAEQVFMPVELAQIVRTQADMRRHFGPILELQGTRMRRSGWRLARAGRPGEEIRTIVDGEPVAAAVVSDDRSMVVREESADRELYVLGAAEFALQFETAGVEISNGGSEFNALRDRGFRYYKRRGAVLVHKVTDKDMEYVPGGRFQVSFSNIPQPLKTGDYLAVEYPNHLNSGDVFLQRNAEQVYVPEDETEGSLHKLPDGVSEGSQLRALPSDKAAVDAEPVLSSTTPVQQPTPSCESPPCAASSVSLLDTGVLLKSELEDALYAAATKQAELASRWYKTRGAVSGSVLEANPAADETETEAAVASWLSAIPSGSRALLVLLDGSKYLKHDAPRELLRRLLRTFSALHLLLTAKSQADAEVAPIDPHVRELPRVVEVPAMSQREAAEVFHAVITRRRPCRLLRSMGKDAAIAMLQDHDAIRCCKGRLGDVVQVAESLHSSRECDGQSCLDGLAHVAVLDSSNID